ncbi:MAG: hypothetical protein AAGA48_35440 [Myxococcota bacterium]
MNAVKTKPNPEARFAKPDPEGGSSPVGWVLCTRSGLDLLWGPSSLGFSMGQMGTVGLIAAMIARIATSPRPWKVPGPAFAFAAWVGFTLLRTPLDRLAWVYAGHWLGPLILGLAVTVRPPPLLRLMRPALFGVLFTLGVAAWMARPSGSGWIVLHGWSRLVGGHGNVHTLAATMALATPLAVGFALQAKRPSDRGLGWTVAIAAAIALILTWVRASLLTALLTGTVAWIALRQWRWAMVLVGVGGILALGSGRFASLWKAAQGQAPSGGWDKLGSSRVEIWRHTLEDFANAEPAVWLFGHGLGGHLASYRHFEPHSEVLALLLQMGGIGLAIALWGWFALGWALLRRTWTTPEAWVALGFGCWASATVLGPASNDLVTRTTAWWWMWALWAGGLAASRARVPSRRPPA